MKRFFKFLVFHCLRFCARKYLKKFPNAKIIGVTGSIGKTGTKEAIAQVLSSRYTVVKSEKSMNTEFGLPLAILGLPSGYRSLPKWIAIFWQAWKKAFFAPHEPIDFFVLEYGTDKPGDMDVLLSVAEPDIAVFTHVAPVHMANNQFRSLEEIKNEKMKLMKRAKTYTVVNGDDELVRAGATGTTSKIYFYGMGKDTKPTASDVSMDFSGLSFMMHYGNITEKISAPIIGTHHVYILLPAILAGMLYGLYPREIAAALETFKLPPGRLNVIPGIRGSIIIDSSYNASPETVAAALETIDQLDTARAHRKIFVFGNMNELGKQADEFHREIGRRIQTDFFITVGSYARLAAEEAVRHGFPRERAISFDTAMDAAKFVQNLIQKSDIVLVKGSQNAVRLERLIKSIMAEPEKADTLLARQDEYWKRT